MYIVLFYNLHKNISFNGNITIAGEGVQNLGLNLLSANSI